MSYFNNVISFLQTKQKEVEELLKVERDLAFKTPKDTGEYEAFSLDNPKVNAKDIEKLLKNAQEYLISLRDCEEFKQFGKSETKFLFMATFFSYVRTEVEFHVQKNIIEKIDALYSFNSKLKSHIILLAYAAIYFMQTTSFEDKGVFATMKMNIFQRLKTQFAVELEKFDTPSPEFQRCVFSLLPLLSCLCIASIIQDNSSCERFDFIVAQSGDVFNPNDHVIIRTHPILKFYDEIPKETTVLYNICPGIKFANQERPSVLPIVCPVYNINNNQTTNNN